MTMRTALLLMTAAMTLVCGPAGAQDSAKVQAESYHVVVDNQKVRVLSFTAKPGMGVCGAGRHSHPDHVTVLLTPARVKVVQNGRTTFASLKAGDSFWEPAVTHEVENYGGADVRSLIIEVKTPAGAK